MTIRYAWDEFVALALREIRKEYPLAGEPIFLKDHGVYNGGVGKAFDIPDFAELPVPKLVRKTDTE